MNRHARRAAQAQQSATPDQVLIVNALRQGKIKMELAAEVFTGWQMLRRLKATVSGRRLLEQALALELLHQSGEGEPDTPADDGTTLQKIDAATVAGRQLGKNGVVEAALSVELPADHPALKHRGLS